MIFLRKLKLFILNGLVLTVISIFLQLIGVSFGVYISNKIGDEAVGLYQLLMSTYSFGITLALSGINLACVRIVSEELAKNSFRSIKKVITKCLIYSLFFGSLTFLLFCIFANMISTYILHEKISPLTICIMAISFPFASICSCLNGYFSAVRHVVKSAFIQILEQFFKILLVSYMLNTIFDTSINSACSLIVLGSSIAEGITCILMFITYIKDRKKLCSKNDIYIPQPSTGITKRIFKISLPISSATYIKSGLATLKQVVIPLKLEASGLSCSEALSKYGMINGMVFPIILFPSTFLSSFSGLLIPEFSSFNVRGENNAIQDSIYKILKYTLIFSFFIIGIFLSIKYFNVTPIIPDKTDKIIDIEIVIPTFVPSLTLKHEAINTPNEFPARFPTNDSNITNPKFVPKSTFKTNTKNIINSIIPIKLTKYAPNAELNTITLFLVGDTAILFPLLLIFAKHLFIAVIPIIPPYIHAIAITV